jgi:HlyD family secretion protein
MRSFLRWMIILAVLASGAMAARAPLLGVLHRRNQPNFRAEEVGRGTIQASVSATGRVEPKLKIQIGAFVSGPIIELRADFNDRVNKGDILAKIDPAIYRAAVQRDRAAVATARAEVVRVQAMLQQARNDERRGFALFEEDEDFVSDAELDRLKFNRMSFEAQLELAKSSVEQTSANLDNSLANLNYTEIKAPSDGTVIDRKIDPGQTLASQFQTPELFILGVDMEEEMYVYASVDEADIGEIRRAQEMDQPAYFRVDAYPEELFQGRIREIRLSSTETQSVVTYPVVVTAANPSLKLLPGMTANLTFQIEERPDVVRVPWSALRYLPGKELVRDEDQHLLTGGQDNEMSVNAASSTEEPSVQEMVTARRQRRRHVWVQAGQKLRAVEVTLGISDYRFAQLLTGDLNVGDRVVVGLKRP